MTATVELSELDPVTRQRILEQIPDAAQTVPQLSCETLDPASLTNDQLADLVIEGVKKIRAYLPYIRTLKERFDSGDRNSMNRLRVPIKGCCSWQEFCDQHLDRSTEAIRKALAVHDGSAHRKPKPEQDQPDWAHEIYLDPDAATELYQMMVNLPDWQPHLKDGPTAKAIYYGLSYTGDGGAADGEIPEIPSFLRDRADEIAAKVGMPVNYIQSHNMGPADHVSPHPDPKGMIVPMLVGGQERTFRVGGEIVGKNGKRFPPMASQASMKNGKHIPKEEIPLEHGSLLVFNGGRTFHSMLPTAKDENFNPNGFERRISILFRYTTDAMRKYGSAGVGPSGTPEHQREHIEEYERAKREFRERIGWNPSPANVPEPKSEEPAPQPPIPTPEPEESSKTQALREWFTAHYEAFALSPNEHGTYDLNLYGVSEEQVKAIGTGLKP